MKITKFGHCCLLIEESGLRILLDPGVFTTAQNELKNLDVILITHEHADHFHIESLKIVLKNNSNAKVITCAAVGKLLEKEGITFTALKEGENFAQNGIPFEAFGKEHALIHSSIPPVENIGFLVAKKFFFPGDAFVKLSKPVEILALPVAGPWMKISEAIDYALELKPKIAIPVHDAILVNPAMFNRIPQMILEPKGIKFVPVELNKEYEF